MPATLYHDHDQAGLMRRHQDRIDALRGRSGAPAAPPGTPQVFHGNYRALDFSGGDWSNADFQEADLRGTNFTGSKLTHAACHGACWWGAVLRDADLSDAQGLTSQQLAGADLTLARLPEDLAKFPMLDHIKSVSENTAKVFLTLLAACAFVLTATSSTPDSQLLLNTPGTKLPLVGVEVPILDFLVAAPLLLLGLHLYLQRLWERLAELPTVFPDGRRREQATYPWLVNDFCRGAYRPAGQPSIRGPGPPAALRMQNLLVGFLLYWLVPLSLLFVWWHGLLSQRLPLITADVLLLGAGTLCSVWSWRSMKSTFLVRGFTNEAGHPEPARGRHRLWYGLTAACLLVLVGCSYGVYAARDAPVPWSSQASYAGQGTNRYAGHTAAFLQRWLLYWWLRSGVGDGFWQRWSPHVLDRLGFSPYARAHGTDFSVKPAAWTGLPEREADELPRVVGVQWVNRRLRHMDFSGGGFVHAWLVGCSLVRANFDHADLRAAKIVGGNATGANFAWVRFSPEPNKAEALLPGLLDRFKDPALLADGLCNVRCADAVFTGADLHDLQARNCRFNRASFELANLQHCVFKDCTFRGANFLRANLHDATFLPATLWPIKLDRSDAVEPRTITRPSADGFSTEESTVLPTDLRGARLINIHGRHADFGVCDVTGADFAAADLKEADLSGAGPTLRPGQLLQARCLRHVVPPPEMDLDAGNPQTVRQRIEHDLSVPTAPEPDLVPRPRSPSPP